MAVDRNPDVMEMVEKKLRENPDISNKDLKLKAEEIDEEVEDLSARQFNARYPLQVKRRLSAEEKDEGDGGTSASEEPAADTAAASPSDDGDGTSREADEEDDEDLRERVMSLVRRLLRQDRDFSTRELQERAAKIDARVRELSTRQFHARFPLQVKRRMSSRKSSADEGDGDGGTADVSEERREAVRQALLDFAKAVAGAEDRGDVVDVLTNVDEYVDRALGE